MCWLENVGKFWLETDIRLMQWKKSGGRQLIYGPYPSICQVFYIPRGARISSINSILL